MVVISEKNYLGLQGLGRSNKKVFTMVLPVKEA